MIVMIKQSKYLAFHPSLTDSFVSPEGLQWKLRLLGVPIITNSALCATLGYLIPHIQCTGEE